VPHHFDRVPQSFLITSGAAAWWWAVWTQLPEWEVTTENGKAGFTEGGRQRHEERRFTICSRTVGEDESIG
jgi:hypothetical protein